MGNFYVISISGLNISMPEDREKHEASNTLAHICRQTDCRLPNLTKMGLSNILSVDSLPREAEPLCAYGKVQKASVSSDIMAAYWEMAGILPENPLPTYPDGFPETVVKPLCMEAGVSNVWANKPYSDTNVLSGFGEKHLQTGYPIVYTSSESVLKIAAHTNITSIDTLYEWCQFMREKILVGKHGVGRVIARPFDGKTGHFKPIFKQQKSFPKKVPEHNLVTQLQLAGVRTYAIGRSLTFFGKQNFTQYRESRSNVEGISQLLSLMSAASNSFIFVSLSDTHSKYGRPFNAPQFGQRLQQFDRAIPAIISKLANEDILIITADFGGNPIAGSIDRDRLVPFLLFPSSKAQKLDLEIRKTLSDIACSAADFFGIEAAYPGQSLLTVNWSNG